MNKPKILILTSSYPKRKGDINGNFVYELSIRLKESFDVFLLAPAFKSSLKVEVNEGMIIYRHRQFLWNIELAYGIGIYENLKRSSLKYFALPFYFLFQFLSLAKIVKKDRINLIHAHWLIPNGLIAVLYKKMFNKQVKILATIHGSDFWGINNKIGNLLKIFTLNNIDELTVVSNALKDGVLKVGYKKEIYVFPMGVDTKLFTPERKDNLLKDKLGIKGKFLLFVGAVIDSKGIRFLIKAMPKVIQVFPNAKLIIVGDGNLKNEIIELTKKLNVFDNVIFTGTIPHENLPSYFATADLFILPSFSEGFGLVIIEALSCKTLTIASDLKPVHDIIIEKETGFYLQEISHEEISNKILYVLLNKEKYLPVSERGREYVVNNFDWDIVKNNYSSLLSTL